MSPHDRLRGKSLSNKQMQADRRVRLKEVGLCASHSRDTFTIGPLARAFAGS